MGSPGVGLGVQMVASRVRAPVVVSEVASGVCRLRLGRGVLASNVYLVRGAGSWVLVDAGWSGSGATILQAAQSLFGPGTPPAGILLTHIHPDHAGAAGRLARAWEVPVFVHPAEKPLAAGGIVSRYANPLDRWVIGPMLRLLPAATRHRIVAASALTDVVQALDPRAEVPGLPGWRCIPTPGHTPGHVAFYRPDDGLLLTGDAVLTIDPNSLGGVVRGDRRLGGPPRYTTWSWPAATASIAALAEVRPRTLGPGHGQPLYTDVTAALEALAGRLRRPRRRVASGILRPVDYSAPVEYRRPPELYRRLQPLGFALAAIGLVPRYVVVLEVPGRRSGLVRRTTLVRATLDGGDYLVSLSGQSQWVRNVRAAGGQVVILARGKRNAATLVEVSPGQRPTVIRAYLNRAGRAAGSRAATREAWSYFGIGPDATDEQLRDVAARYPVFRILPAGPGLAPTVASSRDAARLQPQPAHPFHRRIGHAVEALSAAGYPMTQYAIRHYGKAGATVVEMVCLGLLARDAAMIARGTSRVLRPGPAVLLWLECAVAGIAAVSNAHLLTDQQDVGQHTARHSDRTAERVRRLAVAGLFALHTFRFHIYLQPGQGRKTTTAPVDAP